MTCSYKCRRCEYISTQKESMKRHLEKKKKCLIKDPENKLSDIELYNLSLEKNNNKKIVLNENFCNTCNKKFSNKFTYTRHINNNNNKCYDNKNKINNINLLLNEIKQKNITKCSKKFTRKSSYIRHITNTNCCYQHEDIEIYCSENSKDFINTSIPICNNKECNKIASYNSVNEKKVYIVLFIN